LISKNIFDINIYQNEINTMDIEKVKYLIRKQF